MSSYQVLFQPLGDFATNAYLLVKGSQAIAIDAPPGAYEFYKKCVNDRHLELKYLLLTHSHFDHIADAKIIQDLGVKVAIHDADQKNCQKPGSDGLPLMMDVKPFQPDFVLKEGHFELDPWAFEVMHTPGHTPGGCCFLFDQIMFSGDTFFKQAIGNLSFATCNSENMKNSLKKIVQLQKNYEVYPGHGPKTNLNQEKQNLEYFIKHIG